MKKLIAAILTAFTLVMCFSGCTANELGFYSTIKSMNSLTNYSCSGSMTLNINKFDLGSSSNDADASQINAIVSMLNNANMSYSGTVSTKTNKETLSMTLKTGDGTVSMPFGFIIDNSKNKSIIDVSLPSMLNSYLPTDFKYTKVKIGSTTYYQYDILAIIKQINAAKSDSPLAEYKSAVPSLTELTTVAKSSITQLSIQKKTLKYADSLVNNYLKDFNPDIVKSDGPNSYTISTSVSDLYAVFKDVLSYIGKNPNQFRSLLLNYANSLTDSEVKTLSIPDITRRTALVAAIKNIPFDDIDKAISDMDSGLSESLKTFSSDIKYSLKQSGNTYTTAGSININNNAQKQSTDPAIDITINMNSTVEAQ
jgi:hypothetical protein